MKNYRDPQEHLIFGITLVVIFLLALFTAGLTLCIIPLLLVMFLFYSYSATKSHQAALHRQSRPVEQFPRVAELVEWTRRSICAPQVQTMIVNSKELNAYTFGMTTPNVVVLYSRLFDVMDADEMKFVVGHEMGHVALGHTWLNTLLGGMAGVPTSFGGMIIFTLAFRWWNRACEHSCDRAGLLACGSLDKAITALIKLGSGGAQTAAELSHAYEMLDKQDDSLSNQLTETLMSHPLIINRIEYLQAFTKTGEYRRLAQEVQHNIMSA